MHQIEMHDFSSDFADMWGAAGRHLQAQGDGELAWLKAELHPPFLEHLSFRMGNQVFFVRLEDVSGRVKSPGSRRGLASIAEGFGGHACLMPMRQRGDDWRPASVGWGLRDLSTDEAIEPPGLVTDELVEMTDWEAHDLAVQIVRESIERDGFKLMSWQGNPDVDPSLWFVGKHGPEWVVVRHVRYPKRKARRPANLPEIAAGLGARGNFASVALACVTSPKPLSCLLRGFGHEAVFAGLEPVSSEGPR